MTKHEPKRFTCALNFRPGCVYLWRFLQNVELFCPKKTSSALSMKIKGCPSKALGTAFKTVLGFVMSVFVIRFPWNKALINYNEKKVVLPVPKPWYLEGGVIRPHDGSKRLELWPDEAEGDRILNQLMFVPKNESRPKKKIYLPKLQNLQFQSGSRIFYELNCPVKSCEIVLDPESADAVVFENFVAKLRTKQSFNQIWILHSLESPLFSGKVIQQDCVNWTASYRLDSDLVTPYDKWVYYDENKKVAALQRNYAAEKTKKVVWFVSNCQSKNKRLEYAKILGKFISVDIYGACGDKICPKSSGNHCRDLISNYKFYLSFENANCRDYITEKFYWNALRLDVIPVVMGAPKEDYEKVAPHNSFIHVEDFPSPKHLAEYLHRLDKNDQEYNSYFLWKGTGEFINTFFMCRLCAMLHATRRNYFYPEISRWWRQPETCTRSFWNDTNRNSILKSLKIL